MRMDEISTRANVMTPKSKTSPSAFILLMKAHTQNTTETKEEEVNTKFITRGLKCVSRRSDCSLKSVSEGVYDVKRERSSLMLKLLSSSIV